MKKELTIEVLELIANRFKILSEFARLRILYLLHDGKMTVSELTAVLGTSQPNASKHLRILQYAGIVRREQRGNTVFYEVADDSIFELCEVVCGSLAKHLDRQKVILAMEQETV